MTKAEEENLIELIFFGLVDPYNLPENLYLGTGAVLTDAIYKALNITAEQITYLQAEQKLFFESLKNNAYQFSGAKTLNQVLELSSALLDESGSVVSYKDFKSKANEILTTYNKNYLRTEYDHAFNTSQMSQKWNEAKDNKELFPYLQYLTQGDLRVRKDHEALDLIIKKVDDKFWGTYYPPNGWNCRCNVLSLSTLEEEETNLTELKLPELDPMFEINYGEQKILFSPEHNYYVIANQFDKNLVESNFNLPPAP